jgi:hypothetical protein
VVARRIHFSPLLTSFRNLGVQFKHHGFGFPSQGRYQPRAQADPLSFVSRTPASGSTKALCSDVGISSRFLGNTDSQQCRLPWGVFCISGCTW